MGIQREETDIAAIIYGQKLITSKILDTIMNQTLGSMKAQQAVLFFWLFINNVPRPFCLLI
jgi:hypothetical protein